MKEPLKANNPIPSWPPSPEDHSPSVVAEDEAEEALHYGWRLAFLGLCCAPPVFLPLAAWQGVIANRRRAGSGIVLFLAVGGFSVLWLGVLLLAVNLGTGK